MGQSDIKNYADQGGGGAAEVDNTLLDQYISSYHTKAESNNCFYYSFKIFPSS